LGQVCKSITEVYAPESCHITITLDLEVIEKLKLGIDAESIRQRILKGLPGPTRPAVLRNLTEKHVFLHRSKGNKIRIRPPDTKERGSGLPMKTYFTMQALKAALPEIIVQGIPSVSRAVISSGKSGSYSLFVEGCGLAEVMPPPPLPEHAKQIQHFGMCATKINSSSYTCRVHGCVTPLPNPPPPSLLLR
jgi:DNA-directed RNA polymerase III subunit RPC1